MPWDPGVLRNYNTTGHFRLLNQLRSELKANPLVRPRDGESVGEVNRSRSLIRAIAEKAAATRNRRPSQSGATASLGALPTPAQDDNRYLPVADECPPPVVSLE